MRSIWGRPAVAVGLAVAGLGLSGCAAGGVRPTTFGSGSRGAIVAVGAENEYADVIGQIGGQYVRVSAIMSNPNTDPHTFEASPSVARTIAVGRLIVQNGVGYDGFMNNVEAATPNPGRHVIDVQKLLGLPDTTPNPHLWYRPETMPAVAQAVARGLVGDPACHAAYFQANAAAFKRSLTRLVGCPRRFWRSIPGAAGGHHRARRRLPARGGRDREPQPADLGVGDHERHRPGAAGRRPSRTRCSRAIGSRCSSTTSRSPTR